MSYDLNSRDALIIVDVQNDFCEGGALAVPEGGEVVPVMNAYISLFTAAGANIFATRDWHPLNHHSFDANGGPWPAHCVQGTYGAQYRGDLALPDSAHIIDAGADPALEGYSGFEDTNLLRLLKGLSVRRVFIGGLAIDYCVKHTALDACKHGFEVVYLPDASRGIEASAGDVEAAVSEMKAAGAKAAGIDEING